ncbi:MAG: hypothetical protein K9L30_05555 [Desulfobacterales bacterium]|nr:hypothetical protein [Desulfobacterales bacterium]
MGTDIHGWCGKILKVNLLEKRFFELDTMPYANRFLGGRGIATRIYWEEVLPDKTAFDPENRLIFMTGPLVATGTQGAARCFVAGKSPMLMPEGFCYGNFGSFFGAYLKKAGYDGIIIHGRSDKPVYLLIQDENLQIIGASSLWGKGIYDVGDILKDQYGKTVRYITTGVAGENLCRSANIMTENDGSATGGFGAVFGSKNLKAIAVLGSDKPSIALPEKLKELNKRVYHLCKNPSASDSGPGGSTPPVKTKHCYQCGIDCEYRTVVQTASGKNIAGLCQAAYVYHDWVIKQKEDPETAAYDATRICNDLSICTYEIYNIIDWLEACFRSGYLTEKETGINIQDLGKLTFFENIANMIAHRDGFGDMLAEGLLRTGEKLGEKARAHFSNEVSGVGGGAEYSGRGYLMNALLYAFETRQPISMLLQVTILLAKWVMHLDDPDSSPVTADVFRAAATRFWGHEKAWDLMTYEGKACAAANIIDRTIVKDCLGLCYAVWPIKSSWYTPDHVGDPTLESQLFSAATGISKTEEDLIQYGERIFNLQRAILLREGIVPEKDDFPGEFNFTDPVDEIYLNPDVIVPGPGKEVISRKGITLDRDVYNTMLKEFYEIRGWDSEKGLQTVKTLTRLGLLDIAEEMNRLGLIND